MNAEQYTSELRRRLMRCGATNDAIAGLSQGAVSSSWVSKFRSGKIANPRVLSLAALARALDRAECEAVS